MDEEAPSIELTAPQYDELMDDEHYLLVVCGGRGSGKTEMDGHHILRRGSVVTDQVYAIGANNYDQLHNAIIPRITDLFDQVGEEYRFERRIPKKWRKEWRRKGIRVPQIRLRNIKLLITRSGIHIWLFTLANNSWRKLKSLEVQFLLCEEAWEPGVPLREFLTYAVGSVRCGLGNRKKNDPDVESECVRRGHRHGIVIKGNVPLHQPDNPIYGLVEEYAAKEAKRLAEGKRPYFRLITSRTQDNPHVGEEYIENLRAALDDETFRQQTSGELHRDQKATSYYTFSERNVHEGLKYDPLAPLYFWFDFNPIPAVAGFGQDMRDTEIPDDVKRIAGAARAPFFGILGELFNDQDRMGTEQVASALLENPMLQGEDTGGRQRCTDCPHAMTEHVKAPPSEWICTRCANRCSGVPATVDQRISKYLHVPPNWRGLVNHRGPIYVYADASGKNDTPALNKRGGFIGILRDAFLANLGDRVHFRIKNANPPISERVLSVVRMLQSANGVRSLYVHPRCVGHIGDFREVVPDPASGHPKKVKTPNAKERMRSTYWKRGHITDGLGYMTDFRWPAIIPKAGVMPTVATPELPPDRLEDADYWPEPE